MANITGTTSNDRITLTEATYLNGKKTVQLGNSFKATNSADTIVTGNGDDYVEAGGGDDLIAGGNGNDILYGGDGNDTIYGDALGNPDANDNGTDELYGGAGNDTMYGGNGKDYLDGGADNDTLYGNNGTDILLGGAGSDKLTGGLGGDVLSGGSGADTFVYTSNTASAVSDSPYSAGAPGTVTGTGVNTGWTKSWDIIRDFSGAAGDGDKIDLSALDAYLPAGVDLVWRSPIGTDANAGSANVGLAYGVWTDAGGNFLYADITGDGKADMKIQVSGVGAGDLIGVTTDTTAPTVTITFGDDNGLINDADNADGTVITFQFSEPVVSFDTSLVTTSTGTLTNWTQVDADTWTAVLTVPTDGDGTATVSVPAGSYVDYSSNNGTANSAGIDYDTSNPTVTIDIVDASLDDGDNSSDVTITFSEQVSGFTESDLTVTGGSLSNFTTSDNITWTATFTADDGYDSDIDGPSGISLLGTAYTDVNGNAGTNGGDTVDIDTLNPTLVSIVFEDSSLDDADDTSNVTITFSEPVNDINSSLSATNGTLGTFASSDGGVTWTGTFTADQDTEGSGSITVADGYTDLVGNTGIGGDGGASIDIDTANPTVTIDIVDASLDDGDNVSDVTITFSEVVSGFTESDLTVTGGTLSGFATTDNITWTATFTADDGYDSDIDGPAGISLLGTAYTDVTGNAGTDGSDTVDIDTLNPTVTLSLSPTTLTDSATTATLTITFSEPIDPSTFSLSDFTYDTSLGTLSALTPDGTNTVWTATYTSNDGNDATGATIELNGAYADVVGNSGTGDTVTFDIDRDEGGPPPPPTVDHIVFVPAEDFAKDGDINGDTVGQFIAYDASGNVITGLDWTTAISDKVSINASGAMVANGNLNQGDFEFTLFGTTVHLGIGNGSGNDIGSNDSAYAGDLQILLGLGGGDTLNGDALGDTLWGGNSADTLIGSGGNDILIGGAAGDSLSGGTGDDTFLYFAATDSTVAGRDTITGFEDASDVIDIQALGATSFSTSSLSANGAYAHVVSGNTVLDVDTDGDAVADFSILLNGIHVLSTDNVLI